MEFLHNPLMEVKKKEASTRFHLSANPSLSHYSLHTSSTPRPLPHSLFFILPFLWTPRPKPDFFWSLRRCLPLPGSFFKPPLCKNLCFSVFLSCFRIWSPFFSSEHGPREPPPLCWPGGPRGWELGPRDGPPRPRSGLQERGGRQG